MYPTNQPAMIPYNTFGYNGQAQYGMGVVQQPKPKYTQPLTPEIISKLRSNSDSFEIKVNQEDLWKACCTHKENGAPTLVQVGTSENGNDILRCTICGATFEMIDTNVENVEKITNDTLNLLQTTKTLYLDMPEELAKQYFQMIPLLEKLPKLYERSQKNFNMYESALGITPSTNVMGNNGFQMMGAMLSNPYAAWGGYQAPVAPQPQMAYGYGQPAPMAPQPQMTYPQAPYGYGQPAPMMGNPIMYGTPAPAPAPQAPAAGVTPPAPPVTANGDEVSQQKQFNV